MIESPEPGFKMGRMGQMRPDELARLSNLIRLIGPIGPTGLTGLTRPVRPVFRDIARHPAYHPGNGPQPPERSSAMPVLIACLAFAAAQSADSLPLRQDPPGPLRFADGSEVKSPEDWRRRREEMLDLVMRYEYGRVPPPPGNVRAAKELESRQPATPGFRHRAVSLVMGPDERIATIAHLYLPAKGEAPYPVIVRFGLDAGPAPQLTGRGYAYACFNHQLLDPDVEGGDVVGAAQTAYPDYDWASIAVWAWGACRVLDWLETVPEIDAEKAVITGHSRTGKTALLAGALDERWAIVAPNGSGCGGAGLFRGTEEGAETLELITLPSRWKSWFHDDFGEFAGKEARLPFDQHFMRALVAPRVLISTDALGDTWANPPGTQRAWTAAQPAFDFLGVPGHNLCHFREGGHDQLEIDYAVLLDVADWHFRGKPLERGFSTRPLPESKG